MYMYSIVHVQMHIHVHVDAVLRACDIKTLHQVHTCRMAFLTKSTCTLTCTCTMHILTHYVIPLCITAEYEQKDWLWVSGYRRHGENIATSALFRTSRHTLPQNLQMFMWSCTRHEYDYSGQWWIVAMPHTSEGLLHTYTRMYTCTCTVHTCSMCTNLCMSIYYGLRTYMNMWDEYAHNTCVETNQYSLIRPSFWGWSLHWRWHIQVPQCILKRPQKYHHRKQ